MSIRENIVDFLETNLQTILQSNGYRTDIGNTVYKWRSTALNQSETQSLIFKDTKNRVESSNNFEHEMVLTVDFNVFYSGSDPVSNVRDAVLDIYEFLGKENNENMGGYAYKTEYIEDSIDSEHLEENTANGYIILEIYYILNKFKPNTQGYTI